MTVGGSAPNIVPSDQMVGTALRLARLWRRFAEHRFWRPVADATAVQGTQVPWAVTADDAATEDWLATMRRHDQGPVLGPRRTRRPGLDQPAGL